MNRPARLVPFAILAAAALAQQEPERVTVVTTLLVQTNASGSEAVASTPSPRKDLPGLAAQPIEVALALHDLPSNRGTAVVPN